MCMCGPPNVNGQPGYSWNGEGPGVRPVDPPELQEDDQLLFDEPGRCGGLDAHCYHFRFVRNYNGCWLLVKHGAGTERLKLPLWPDCEPTLRALTSTERFWLFFAMSSLQRSAAAEAKDQLQKYWTTAAAEKRIQTRKLNRAVRVSVQNPKTGYPDQTYEVLTS